MNMNLIKEIENNDLLMGMFGQEWETLENKLKDECFLDTSDESKVDELIRDYDKIIEKKYDELVNPKDSYYKFEKFKEDIYPSNENMIGYKIKCENRFKGNSDEIEFKLFLPSFKKPYKTELIFDHTPTEKIYDVLFNDKISFKYKGVLNYFKELDCLPSSFTEITNSESIIGSDYYKLGYDIILDINSEKDLVNLCNDIRELKHIIYNE